MSVKRQFLEPICFLRIVTTAIPTHQPLDIMKLKHRPYEAILALPLNGATPKLL